MTLAPIQLRDAAEASVERAFANSFFFRSSRDTFGGPSGTLHTKVERLEAVGLLDPKVAQEWKARALRFSEEFEQVVPDVAATRDLARDFLRSLIERRKTSGGDDPATEYFYGAANTFRDAGLFSEREWNDWTENWEEVVDERSEDFKHDIEIAGGFEGSRVEAVVAGPEIRSSGLRVTALARFEDGLCLYWHFNGLPVVEETVSEDDPWFDPFEGSMPSLTVTDDVETEYVNTQGGSMPVGGTSAIGRSSFAPKIPSDAKRIFIESGESKIEFSI
jgi:hypothetical protein